MELLGIVNGASVDSMASSCECDSPNCDSGCDSDNDND